MGKREWQGKSRGKKSQFKRKIYESIPLEMYNLFRKKMIIYKRLAYLKNCISQILNPLYFHLTKWAHICTCMYIK